MLGSRVPPMAMMNAPHALVFYTLGEGLSGNQCMNGGLMPLELKLARLAEVEGQQLEGQLPPSGVSLKVRSGPRASYLRKKPRKWTVWQLRSIR